MKSNIIFCGTPDFACPTLAKLNENNTVNIIRVITQPDKIRTRGRQTSPTPIKALASKLNIETSTPTNKTEFKTIIEQLNPDLIIVIAYGMILPKEIVDNYFCINLHASLLPLYRGASPIQTALLNNDTITGVTLIHMNEKMDEGDILAKQQCDITHSDNFLKIHNILATLSATLCLNWINQAKKPIPIKQEHSKASYCKKIQKEDLELKITSSPTENYAKIRAFSPTPGAFIIKEDKRIKILEAKLENDIIIPTLVKPEGKKLMSYSDFKKGYNISLL